MSVTGRNNVLELILVDQMADLLLFVLSLDVHLGLMSLSRNHSGLGLQFLVLRFFYLERVRLRRRNLIGRRQVVVDVLDALKFKYVSDVIKHTLRRSEERRV